MLPIKVQLKFQRREAPRTGLFRVLGGAGFEGPADSGAAVFNWVPSFDFCWRSSFENGVGPVKPDSGEDMELGTELMGAPKLVVFRARLFAASHATREASSIVLGCMVSVPRRRTGTC